MVLLVIGVGVFYIDTDNYDPFFPFGFGAFAGAATVFFAVFGYDAMSTAAEESTDSQSTCPRRSSTRWPSRWCSTCWPALVLTGMVRTTATSTASGVLRGLRVVGLPARRRSSPRRDPRHPHGAVHLPPGRHPGLVLDEPRRAAAAWFAKTHPKHVPTRITWILGGSAVIAGFLPITEAAELTNIGILLAFVVVCIAVIVLRYRRPDLPRTFRRPGCRSCR